jgi:hypothetical protein
MANEVLQKVGGQIAFNVSGSFSPADDGTNWTIGSPTEYALTLAGVADAAGRQSIKADLGATRAAAYEVLGCVDFTGETPTQGGTIDYYWMPSTSGTGANGNVLGNSGADADAPGGAVGAPTLADMIAASIFIGSLPVHDGAAVQNGFVGVLAPPGRYGQLLVVNNGGDAFEDDDVEMHQVFNPIADEIQ